MKVIIIMVCTKKIVQERWAILSPKMAHPHDSVSTVRIFLKFFVMKGADSYIEVLLVFREKISFGVI